MKYKHLIVVIIGTAIIFGVGCMRPPERTESFSTDNTQNDRIKIERVGIINDQLAYHSQRGVYIITDTKTGKEYIGVSGIGISDVGHSGKVTIER